MVRSCDIIRNYILEKRMKCAETQKKMCMNPGIRWDFMDKSGKNLESGIVIKGAQHGKK